MQTKGISGSQNYAKLTNTLSLQVEARSLQIR